MADACARTFVPLFVLCVTPTSEDSPDNLPKSILLCFHPIYLQTLQHIYVQSTGTYIRGTDPIYCLLENHILNESLNTNHYDVNSSLEVVRFRRGESDCFPAISGQIRPRDPLTVGFAIYRCPSPVEGKLSR